MINYEIQESKQWKGNLERHLFWIAENGVGCQYVIFANDCDSLACLVLLQVSGIFRFHCPCRANQSFQKCSQSVWENCDLTSTEHCYSKDVWEERQKPNLSWEHFHCPGPEGCQLNMEQPREELIKENKLRSYLICWRRRLTLCCSGLLRVCNVGMKPPPPQSLPGRAKLQMSERLILYH